MRPVAVVALVVFAGWLTARWVTGKPRRPIFISLFLIGAGLLAGQEIVWQREADRYSQIAANLSQRPEATVRCERLSEAWFSVSIYSGWVPFGPDGQTAATAQLNWQTCRDLRAYVKSDKTAPTFPQILAVHVLSHEVEHVRGTTNEAETECLSLQRDATVVRLLGGTAQQGQALAERYWREAYPRMRADYRTSDCAPGQPLDQDPKNPSWP